jgi:hypothetical protein
MCAGLVAASIPLAPLFATSAAQAQVVQGVRARSAQPSSSGSIQMSGGTVQVIQNGQVTVFKSGNSSGMFSGGAVPPELMGQVPGASGDAAAAPTPRLAPLQQLQFDRRPSAILAAWAELDKAPEVKPDAAAPASAGPGDEITEQLAALGYAVGGVAIAPSSVPPSGTAPTLVAPTASAPVALAPVPAAPTATSAAGAPTAVAGQPAASTPSAAGTQPATEAQPAEAAPDAEAAAAAAAAAEEARKKAEEDAKKAAEAPKAIEKEMADLRRNVTLGRWSDVGTYLKGLSKAEGEAGYEHMLQSLEQGPPQMHVPDMPPQGRMYLEKNQFSPGDVVGLAAAAPRELKPEDLKRLGQILRQALDSGHQLGAFLREVAPRIDAEKDGIAKRALARLLVAANEPIGLESLVPALEEAVQANDREGLNLIARHALARHAEKGKSLGLEQAWQATQAALAAGDVELEAKREALTRAVEIAPRVQAELGQAWLDESFTARPERGMEILATIGGSAAQALSMKPMDAVARQKLLELQTTAAKALLAAAPELAEQWSAELSLLAANWLREALHTYQFDESTARGQRMRRDMYGNAYWYDSNYGPNSGMAAAIPTGKLLEFRPDDAWLGHVEATLRPRLSMIYAQLLLKVGEEAEAFPYIEALAASDPRPAKELVDEFLRVWSNNHNPNQASSRTSQYVYFFGFEERSGAIPLTRSKQERNLADLAQWVARLRSLPVEVDDKLVTQAFQSAHSSAEIYRLETIEQVFGPLSGLEPKTLAALVQTMRTNLANIWRDPAAQREAKTNRRQQDIQAEVLRGYEIANSTLDSALRDHPASWELALARAALAHDENNYQAEIAKDAQFTSRRGEAMELFHRAAEIYASGVEALDKDDESVDVYQMWFYAALGASDLRLVDPKAVLLGSEIPRIKAALEALPGERAERHRASFASTLFARMSNANPAVKFRYVREGLAVVGDHPLAHEAREVLDYYGDLVTEIQLAARVDGGGSVGTAEPFGLRIDLRHTAAIERESGGFAKYLQNQNNQQYGFNYGRPLEDYRDKFEEAARETLTEHFDVLSVTFNDPKAQSIADAEYGWRVTPYAYVLLKPRGPEVDLVPPLRLDLDFLDTSGYAVLPVESAPRAIDVAGERGDERPYERLSLTQTLDERRAKDGKLVLEVKAGALGIVPPLDALLDLAPEGFDVVETEDHGVSVVKFDEERDGVVSERTWTISLRGKEGLSSPPTQFAFAEAKVETTADEHFRYVDADLAAVGPVVDLEAQYAEADRTWIAWIAVALGVVAVGVYAARRLARPAAAQQARFRVPETVNAFTVLGVLRDIQSQNGLTPDAHGQLEREISELEALYFGDGRTGGEPDLRQLAERWVSRAR